jgi:hypothetical protein
MADQDLALREEFQPLPPQLALAVDEEHVAGRHVCGNGPLVHEDGLRGLLRQLGKPPGRPLNPSGVRVKGNDRRGTAGEDEGGTAHPEFDHPLATTQLHQDGHIPSG